ncbi:response regulator [Massilia sp. R2A-15]|uniref:response regulator transcription factor n=1 Tax=Massilia sp. R2A-15 TaxID=3064278 RepID=UPI0028046D8F|nr:response regulator [Massilia sp. R2A-15]
MIPHPLILNVDDNDAARHAKTRLLMNAGFAVQEASNGIDAMMMVAKLLPRLVLLDVKLPDISGAEVCRRLKADPATHGVLVLQTSAALVSLHDTRLGMAAGADSYLAAPFEPSELIARVRSLLAASQ